MTGTAVRRLLVAVIAGGLCAGLPVLTAGPAAALSCVAPATVLRGAEQVFTARFVSVDLATDEAVVEVEDVWWGGPVDDTLTLVLGLPGWWDGTVASGEPDTEWLWVMAPVMERGRPSVNPCTAWSPETPGVGRFDPGTVTPPTSAGTTTGTTTGPITWWSALLAGLRASLRV
ncbi:hypothetical protein [uncultured Nocardioides sp.]|uniref:hypothetical protein n=1 Tax=uncultured Nocardioides sp. TaxID=198441 RepID=UPI0026173FFE|nr:hypothetical protein [uncultured Nocardioides sp.]